MAEKRTSIGGHPPISFGSKQNTTRYRKPLPIYP